MKLAGAPKPPLLGHQGGWGVGWPNDVGLGWAASWAGGRVRGGRAVALGRVGCRQGLPGLLVGWAVVSCGRAGPRPQASHNPTQSTGQPLIY